MPNHRLELLKPYPFQRLNDLLKDIEPADLPFISLALGEPKHPAADFLIDAYRDENLIRQGFAAYPPTKGLPELRTAIAEFLNRRYQLPRQLNPETEVLPVNGSREGLFAIAQALIDPSTRGKTLMPNPFYQIYEGAALLAGTEPVFMNCTAENGFLPNFDDLDEASLNACEMMFLCTPGNPSGAVMSIESLQQALALAAKYNFIVVSDECYSEIYADEDAPPPGLLQAAAAMGNDTFENCITFNSLSKRSNLPGLRSGYVAGNAALIEQFLLYRTYHGSAMSVHNQHLSALAWQDEQHVIENRALYRAKYQQFAAATQDFWPMEIPSASFYLWPEIPSQFEDDEAFAQALMQATNIKVLPGSYLSRISASGVNPGHNRVRMALVATLEECLEAAERLENFLRT
jgi:N-succinyldiaminopimelate aminotransferase